MAVLRNSLHLRCSPRHSEPRPTEHCATQHTALVPRTLQEAERAQECQEHARCARRGKGVARHVAQQRILEVLKTGVMRNAHALCQHFFRAAHGPCPTAEPKDPARGDAIGPVHGDVQPVQALGPRQQGESLGEGESDTIRNTDSPSSKQNSKTCEPPVNVLPRANPHAD